MYLIETDNGQQELLKPSEFYKRIGMEIGMETRVPELDDRHGVGPHYNMIWSL